VVHQGGYDGHGQLSDLRPAGLELTALREEVITVKPIVPVFDVNCGCGAWPFRPTLPADACSLEELLRAEGVTRACAYPLEAYLWPDPQEANELRLPQLARSSFFVPSAALNPTLRGWRKGYLRCRGEWGVPMVRLLPNYHLYELNHPSVDELAEQAASDGVVLGVHVRAEDKRMQNPIAKVPPVPIDDVVALARRHPGVRVVVFGFGRLWDKCDLVSPAMVKQLQLQPELAQRPALPENLWIELSFFEHESSFANALRLFPPERLLFGSHAPLFYPRANVAKIEYSEAPSELKAAAYGANAERLLGVKAWTP
jgi:predicted TIM-barrel fold metal-dependent hydrolase